MAKSGGTLSKGMCSFRPSIQNTLDGRLTIPFTWRTGGQVEMVDEAVGWMRGAETFVCAFEMGWSVQ